MIGFVMKAVGYVGRRSLPYIIVFTAGAVVGSGVLSERKEEYHLQQIKVSDEQGRHYIVDLEKKVLICKPEKKENSRLTELLK